MTKYEFIFSHRRSHRIARHIVFWFLWCLVFNVLFHFPIHVFKGWNISGPGTRNYQELGPVLFFFKALLVNSFLAVIVPQILLIYVLMYWVLPRYFYRRRNYMPGIGITVAVLVVFYFAAVGFKHSTAIYNWMFNRGELWPYLDPFTQRVVIVDQVSSLPIIAGVALMIKLVKKWWLKQKETEQLSREKTKAELQLLKAQVHPHFLFNTINNIYFFMLSGSARAPEMIKKLSNLLRYILNECNQPLVPLDKEIKMIENYVALERVRYGEHLKMSIEIEGTRRGKMIPPLLLLPFVENSFKHGASKMLLDPWVKIKMRIEDGLLFFVIVNNKPSVANTPVSNGNIGLRNVRKRLELLYGGRADLHIVSDAECFSVDLSLQLLDETDNFPQTEKMKPENENAVA